MTAASAARYYPDLQRLVSTRYGGGVLFEVIPAERWTVQTTGAVSYSPYYTVVLGVGPPVSGLDSIGPSADYRGVAAGFHDLLVVHRREAGLQRDVEFEHVVRRCDTWTCWRQSESADQRAGFRYTRAMSKSFSLNIGYQQAAITQAGRAALPSLEQRAIYSSNLDLGLGIQPHAVRLVADLAQLQHRHVDGVDRVRFSSSSSPDRRG